jgi:hypothetical protein
MLFLPAVPSLVLFASVVRASRESESSAHQAASRLSVGAHSEAHATAGAASVANAQAEVEKEIHARKLRKEIIEQCRQAQEAREAGKETKETVKTLGDCINQLAEIAQATAQQREKSREANKLYADDMIMAKKIMAYLGKKMSAGEQNFEHYRQIEKRREQELTDLMQRIGSNHRMDSSSSLQIQQLAVPENVVNPSQFQSYAAMFTPKGQSFGVPPISGGLMGRQPSLLQLGGGPPPWSQDAGAPDLQAKLDREAQQLEESDSAEDMGTF